MNECARARELMPGFVDGESATEQAEWLEGHLEGCAGCRAALAEFAAIDRELTGWGRQLASKTPAASGAREQLAARLASPPVRPRVVRWWPAAAAAIAAAMFVAVLLPHKKLPPAASGVDTRFIGIPYLPPLDPRENAAVVRMNIRVATLIAAGYRVTADPNAIVSADVLVGEDGRAHAVRMLSDIHLN